MFAAVFWIATPCNTNAQNCPNARQPVTNIGERFTSTVKFQAGSMEREREIPHPGARYLRARIEVPNPGTCNWLLTVRDAGFHVIQTLNQDDFSTTLNRWTNRVPSVKLPNGNVSSKIIFTLAGCKNGSTPEIKFPEYIMMAEKTRNPYYSRQSQTATYKPLYQLTETENPIGNKPLGDYVGFVMVSWLRTSWTCSGVFLTENLLLTNWHCGGPRELVQDGQTIQFPESGYWQDQIVKDTIIDISFDDDGLSMEYIGKKRIAMDPDLDFALLEVVPLDAMKRMLPLPINLAPLANNQSLKIVHHPEALQKNITFGVNCRVESNNVASWRNQVSGIDFSHRCDTEGGSSGAPIFNANGELVGLHHRGFDIDPCTCAEKDKLNKAVRIDKIFEYLQACNPDVAARLLLATPAGPAKACPLTSPAPSPSPACQ